MDLVMTGGDKMMTFHGKGVYGAIAIGNVVVFKRQDKPLSVSAPFVLPIREVVTKLDLSK